jgi:hypothetical protein
VLRWEEPIELRDDHVRRIFAQELVIELRRVGATDIDEMYEARVSLLRIPAEKRELAQVAEATRRMGWVELRDRPGKASEREWAVTELGSAVRRPASLQVLQVFSRVLHFAGPVRAGVTDWLPVLAIVAGAVAAQQVESLGSSEPTLVAIRVVSIAVLGAALVWGAIGEVHLLKAMAAFKRVQSEPGYGAARRFHWWPRLLSVIGFDALLLVVFGMALFLLWPALLLVAIPTFTFALAILLSWNLQAKQVWHRRPSELPQTH